MIDYFKTCETLEELKAAHLRYIKTLHPDNGGSHEEFVEMQAQFKGQFDILKRYHRDKTGASYEKETAETADEYLDILFYLLRLKDCSVSLLGAWLWVEGNTKPYRHELKNLGCRYAPKKKAWYWHSGEYKRHHRTEYSLDEIRGMYGGKDFRQENPKQIVAL